MSDNHPNRKAEIMNDTQETGFIQGRTFKEGDKVRLRATDAGKYAGIVFTVKRLLKTNVLLTAEEAPRGLRCPQSMLVDVDDPAGSVQAAARAYVSTPILWAGTVFRMTGREGLWVVLAQNASGRYRAAKLGGDGGRYLTNIDARHMTVVDPSDI